MHAENVPLRAKDCPEVEDAKEAVEQPYDNHPVEIRKLHERYRYDINDAPSAVVDLELGKRDI